MDKSQRFSELAIKSYRKSDESRWVSALFCWKVVGGYERGKTLGLAADMSVSVDTIEGLAHAYSLYEELSKLEGARKFLREARKLPYIYMAHFRSLYDLRERFNLTIEQVFGLLLDVVMGEGELSSRDLDGHVRRQLGKEYTYHWYAQKALRDLMELNNRPDCPKEIRELISDTVSALGEKA